MDHHTPTQTNGILEKLHKLLWFYKVNHYSIRIRCTAETSGRCSEFGHQITSSVPKVYSTIPDLDHKANRCKRLLMSCRQPSSSPWRAGSSILRRAAARPAAWQCALPTWQTEDTIRGPYPLQYIIQGLH